MPVPNDTSSESCLRDVSNVDLFGTNTVPTVEISTMENRPRGGWCYIHRRIYIHGNIDRFDLYLYSNRLYIFVQGGNM